MVDVLVCWPVGSSPPWAGAGCPCAGGMRRQSWLWEISELGGEGTCLVTFLVGSMLVFYDPEPPDLLCNEDREVSANFSL